MQSLQHRVVIQRCGIKLAFFGAIEILLSRTGWGCATHVAGTWHCSSSAWSQSDRCRQRRMSGPKGSADFLWFLQLNSVPTPLPPLKSKSWTSCREENTSYMSRKMQMDFFFFFCFASLSFFTHLCLCRHVERQSIPKAVELEIWRLSCASLACRLDTCPAVHKLPRARWSPRERCLWQEWVEHRK